MTEIMIAADSLSRAFGQNEVLQDISLNVSAGSVCSLLGPNGAGKTTLLKLLMGLIEPTRGLVGIAGDFNLPRKASTLQTTGCLIDGFEPPPATRIEHLVALSREVSPEFDAQRARELLAQKNLPPKAAWKTLSKGQKRWVLLTMLLCRRCRVLLLDEPADGLDPEARHELYHLIRREANDHGVTALITTHIINDIEKITDDVCILHENRIVLHSDLEELREQTWVIETEEEAVFPPEVRVLKNDTTNRCTYWLRDTHGNLPPSFPTEIRRRSGSLEEIYLAVTTAGTANVATVNEQTVPVGPES